MKYLTGDNCTVRVEVYAKMVISNYTGRYTTIHRRNRPSDKRNPPFRSTSRYSAKTLFLFAAATLFLRNKYGNPNLD